MTFEPLVQQQLDRIVQRVVETVPTHAIYLFGSYARGDQHKDSDLDIFVLTQDDSKRPIEYIHDIRHAIHRSGQLPVDVLASPWQQFERMAQARPTLEYTIAKEGFRIY
ncbi:hypothetical protein AGMMS49992_13420 [Clostridia bacterium]|nr:hypothetical protein AGMMS49992_13420 [Clostridia bacterium]